ncbi:MAG TPA: hypothetical protein VGE45_04600 [Chloroflexia bacterium]|jgi:hypothetical protein
MSTKSPGPGAARRLLPWAIVIAFVLLVACPVSAVAYVAITQQNVSLGTDTLSLEIEPAPPGAPFLNSISSGEGHEHCSNGSCTSTMCKSEGTQLLVAEISIKQCTVSTQPLPRFIPPRPLPGVLTPPTPTVHS